MGQKVNPVAFRTGVMETWKSRWYAPKREYSKLLLEDKMIRDFIKNRKEKLVDAKGKSTERLMYPQISKIEIERTREEVNVIVRTARPAAMIGRKEEKRLEDLTNQLQFMTGRRIKIQILEEKKAPIIAQLVAEDIGEQLIKRASFRRTMKRAIELAMDSGAKGIKIQLSGRLGGAEMARCEKAADGSIPLSTLRAKIDYGFTEAKIAQGHIGIQVWINQGEYSEDDKDGQNAQKSQTSKNPKRAYKR